MAYFSEWFLALVNPAGPEFWLLVATLIFLGIVWKKGGFAQLGKALDNRADAVRKALDQARALREEAQALLADYQKRQREAEAEAATLIANAKAEAERYKADEIAKVQDFVTRRTRLAEQKIAQAEAQAIAEVRSVAADAAVAAATTVLAGKAAGGDGVMVEALKQVRAQLN